MTFKHLNDIYANRIEMNSRHFVSAYVYIHLLYTYRNIGYNGYFGN